MQYTWIKNNSKKLIVFFNGWGCDMHQFTHLKAQDFDVLLIHDYRVLTLKSAEIEKIKAYGDVNVVAWSYGVWVAQRFWGQCQLPKNRAIAINGTTQPVSEEYGIAERIMQGTLELLSERNMMKFQNRMVGGKAAWEKFKEIKPQRHFNGQKEELAALIEHFKQEEFNDVFYDKALVGKNDLIFLADNQLKFWEDKVTIEVIDASHYCFFEYETWKELLA